MTDVPREDLYPIRFASHFPHYSPRLNQSLPVSSYTPYTPQSLHVVDGSECNERFVSRGKGGTKRPSEKKRESRADGYDGVRKDRVAGEVTVENRDPPPFLTSSSPYLPLPSSAV